MEIQNLAIPDVKVLTPKRFGDHRGSFCETYNKASFLKATGCDVEFVQDNHSMSAAVGTVRALHYQLPPFAQGKLVRVVKGAIYDVAVDIRRSSPTFGKFVGAKLTEQNGSQIWVPVGFAHGFITLEPNTEVLYKVTAPYSPQHERGLRWNDPAIGINWDISADAATLNDRDKNHPLLKNQIDLFE